MSIDTSTVKEGDELPVLHLQPDLGQVIRYCALQWAFPPFFYDAEAAEAYGMPGTLVPGPLKVGLLYRAIDEWLGDAGWVRYHLAVAYEANQQPEQAREVLDRAFADFEEQKKAARERGFEGEIPDPSWAKDARALLDQLPAGAAPPAA